MSSTLLDCSLNPDLGVAFLLVMEFRPQGRLEEKIKTQVFVKSQDKILIDNEKQNWLASVFDKWKTYWIHHVRSTYF